MSRNVAALAHQVKVTFSKYGTIVLKLGMKFLIIGHEIYHLWLPTSLRFE